MKSSRWIVLAALSFTSTAAEAQDLPNEAEVNSITKGGVPEGCSVQYTTMTRDHVYKSGAVVGISGSLAWLLHPKMGLGLSLKLIAADLALETPNSLRPFKVEHGFVTVNGNVLQVEQRYSCDQATGFCGAVGLDKAIEVSTAYANGNETVSFGFNRTPNGLDVVAPVTRLTAEQGAQLAQCFVNVLEEAQRRSGDAGAR